MRFPSEVGDGQTSYGEAHTDLMGDAPILNSLLRGEISAAEAYDLAIGKFEGKSTEIELRQIRDEHHAAMSMLRERIQATGDTPVESSGAWGAMTTLVTGTALALGGKPVLGALRHGEEHGVSAYRKAADAIKLSHDCRSIIAGELLPMCQRHVATLEQLRDALN